MNEKIKNTIAIIFIILALGVIGYCGYRIYNKLNGNDTSNNVVEKKETNNKQNNKEENNNEENNNVVENDSKNADMNKSVLVNLYDNGVIKSMDIREAITSEIDFTLDYGKINNHNVKIKIYVHNTGDNLKYKQTFDVYVDDNKYNLFDAEDANIYSNGIGELFENLEIKTNNIGILFISNIKTISPDKATKAFVLIYNKANQYEFIGEKVINKYVRTANTTYGNYDKNKEESNPINVSADSIEYCKYDNSADKEFCGGKAKVSCVTYNGKEESIKQQFEAYIHEQLC